MGTSPVKHGGHAHVKMASHTKRDRRARASLRYYLHSRVAPGRRDTAPACCSALRRPCCPGRSWLRTDPCHSHHPCDLPTSGRTPYLSTIGGGRKRIAKRRGNAHDTAILV